MSKSLDFLVYVGRLHIICYRWILQREQPHDKKHCDGVPFKIIRCTLTELSGLIFFNEPVLD
jgi:hypothetical protein